MAKKKSGVTLPPAVLGGLREADGLIRQQRMAEAQQVLLTLDRHYPNRSDVLSGLAHVYQALGDWHEYLSACQRLASNNPHDPDMMLALGGAYMQVVLPALALRTMRRFVELFPEHERAGEAREQIGKLVAHLDGALLQLGLSGPEGLGLVEVHEELRALMGQGRWRDARKVADELLRRRPDFVPALNNISHLYQMEGDLAGALLASQRVLSLEPDNVHALGDTIRVLVMMGRMEEAQEVARRLRATTSTRVDTEIKMAEALSYLGDDAGVLEAFRRAEQADHLVYPPDTAMFRHFAAVASLHLGNEAEALLHWDEALRLWPGMDLAQENRADRQKPPGERHGPWAFSLANWLPRGTWNALGKALGGKKSDEVLRKAAARFVEEHAELGTLLPILLLRGDPEARNFALQLALLACTGPLLQALRDFALEKAGPDVMRRQAAHAASAEGVLPVLPVRLWLDGEWREILPVYFELHEEPITDYSLAVRDMLAHADAAVNQGEVGQAEALLALVKEVAPEIPEVLNNLSTLRRFQGRHEEADALLAECRRRFPHYLFALVNVAREHIRRGELEQAAALLLPLRRRTRLHRSEFAVLCVAQIELQLKRGDRDAARAWVDLWHDEDPERPELQRYRELLRG